MAKRRRNRRNRRRPYRQSPNQPQNTPKVIRNAVLGPAVQPPDNNSITTTPLNRHQSPSFTPLKNAAETPRLLRSNSLVLRKKINVESNGRARSNSFVTPKIKVRNDLNCTNLNQLFEEKLRDSVQKNLKYSAINSNLLSEVNRCRKFEEKPQNVEPIKMDVATQTVYFNRTVEEESTYHVHSFAQIFETPKNCLNEFTIFSPPCVASSTPIDAFYRPEVLANVARNMVHPKQHAYNYDFTTSHKSVINNRDLNYHQSPVFDKNRVFSINKHRFYKTCSPRVARNAYVKINRHRQEQPGPPALYPRKPSPGFAIPKSFTPIRRCSAEKSTQNILNVSSGSAYGRIMTRLRSFHKNHTSKWIGKLMEVCQWFGITLKMGVSKFRRQSEESPGDVAAAVEAICDCEKNKEKLASLETKLNQLEQNHVNQVQTLTSNLQEVTSELSRIRTELAELVSMKTIHSGGDVVLPKAPPPPPPPPPPMPVAAPPPPPPPPMPLGTNTPLSRGGIKITRANREDKKAGKEEARPVISLDDILKVKLKKPGERYQTPPTLQRRNTQPVISMDMLRQVKLRPASRPQTPSFDLTGAVSGVSLPTSPSSSLTRLLSKAAADSNANASSASRRLRPT